MDSGITVVVFRRVKLGHEADYLVAMREFIDATRLVEGHLGMQIILPAAGSRDYTIIDRFANQMTRDAFTNSSSYHDWMQKLSDMTEGDPRINELAGLEGWFSQGDVPALPSPSKYKMATATLLGVFPVTLVLSFILDPLTASWPPIFRKTVFSALMVALLTWLVMPIITRLLHSWLFSDNK